MALYTEVSFDDMASDWDNLQRRRREQQFQDLANQYTGAQNSYNQAQAKKTGLLESVLSGISNSIGNVGKSLYDLGGTTIANWRDVLEGKNINKEGSYTQAFKKSLYGGDTANDRYAKTAGTALDAAVTLSDLIPIAGAASAAAGTVGKTGKALKAAQGLGKLVGGTGAQIAQGALSGAAQNYIDNGANATLEDTLRGAAVGGASAGVGKYVGGKLAGKTAGNGIISKAANSNIGKAALTGAAAGATGGGLNAALSGGNLLDVAGGALGGMARGAAGGATMAGAMGLAGSAINKLNQKNGQTPTAETDMPKALKRVANQPQTEADIETNPSAHRQKALGWDGEPIDASKRNALQSVGKTLTEAGKRTANADIEGRINNNTARDVVANDTINNLKKNYGYSAGDYDKAANLSEATNRWIKNEVKTSGASGVDNDLVNRVAISDDLASLTEKQAKLYDKNARKMLTDATVPGGTIGEYSAAGLYDASEKAGKLANTYYEKSHNKMDGSVINPELDDLSTAYRNLKNQTRAAADSMLGGQIDDVTRSNLVKMLKDSGAPDAAVKTLSQANSFAELKSLTSPLESARNMSEQIAQTRIKRGATTDATKNPATIVMNKTGITQLADAAASPIGKVVGGIEKGLGKAITAAGDLVAGRDVGGKVGKAIQNTARALNNDALYNTALGDLANRQLARQPGLSEMRNQDAEREAQNAVQQMQNIQNEYNTLQSQPIYDQSTVQQTDPMAERMDTIARAMDMALAAGDITSYGKLADLYKEAYNIYSLQNPTETATTKDLTATQSKALTGLQQLETIKQMTPTLGTALAQTPVVSGVVNALGGDDYANQAQALALTLGYLQSGSNVTSKEAEKIGWSYVPTAYDSENTRQQKLTRAEQLLRNYLANTSAL